eukprot:3268960-Rhodomonas_salina.2
MAAIVMTVSKAHGEKKQKGPAPKPDMNMSNEDHLIDDPTTTENNLARIQRLVREKIFYKNKRLHRLNLAERLNFECATSMGLLRFFNQLMVFGLFVAALSFSSNQEVKRGILSTLTNEFDFEGMSEVSRRD